MDADVPGIAYDGGSDEDEFASDGGACGVGESATSRPLNVAWRDVM